MIGVDEATRLIRDAVLPLPDEDVALTDAGGRILRAPVLADRDVPPFDRVTMDGIAFAYAAVAAGRSDFAIRGEAAAGHPALALPDPACDCLQVMTGAVLPTGCDCVVPIEHVGLSGDRAILRAGGAVTPGQFIHRQGSDHRRGDVLLRAGGRLNAARIGIAASAGCATLAVARLPTIGIVSNGDELVDLGRPVAAHQIHPSNRYALRGSLLLHGFADLRLVHLPDDPAVIERDLDAVLRECDVTILSGGVSAGTRDYIPGALDRLGVRRVFHQVRQRPGKPMWFGLAAHGKPVFALPGNPLSTFICFHRYVLPHLDHILGTDTPLRTAVLIEDLAFLPPLTGLLPVRETDTGDGRRAVSPVPFRGSGDLTALDPATGFIELAADQNEFPAGSVLPYYAWR